MRQLPNSRKFSTIVDRFATYPLEHLRILA